MRGIGIGCFLEVTAPANKEMGGISFDADGGVTIRTGTLDYGQGHASAFAQVLSEKLGVPFEKVRLLQGDSDELLAGGGTGGSRSMMNSGQAIVEAAQKVIEQGKQIASHALEASAGDIEFKDGKFVVAGTDRAIDIMELASKIRTGMSLPPDGPQSLDVKHVSEGAPAAYPNGCHVCEVEVDPDTGNIEVVKYTAVNDFGTIINPMLVDGQTHGGVVQGIGQTLLEHVVYDEQGQLLSGSFMDYAMPRAHHTPNFEVLSHPVPATTNPLGVKGCGEAGCAGSMTSIMNAVVDALSEYGITPHRHAGDARPGSGRRSRTPRASGAKPGAMTVSTEVAVRRAADRRRPPGRGRQCRAFRQPFLHAGAAAAVCLRARRLRGDLHRDWPGADRVQHGLGGGADAGRLPDRSHQRAVRADRGPLARRASALPSRRRSTRTGC